MRIVLLGDLHLFRLWYAPWHLLSKRILGQSNLWLFRRKTFQHKYLPALLEKAIALQPDAVLFSGDLTTTAVPAEFSDAYKAIEPLVKVASQAVAVPGNHDRYTFTAARTKRMERMMGGLVPDTFPHFCKLDENWNLLALDAAIPRIKDAVGRIGNAQLDAAAQYISSLDETQGLVVLCHYPCVVPEGIHEHTSHQLADAQEIRALLETCKARVVYLHGHIHHPWHATPSDTSADGQPMSFTCIDAGAPCMVSDKYPKGQGFYEIDLPEEVNGEVRVVHHTL